MRVPVNTERNSLYDCIEGVDRVDWDRDLGQSLFTRRVGELLVALYFLFGQSYLIYNFLELKGNVIKGKGSCIYYCGRVKTRSFRKRLE